jgi:hypothetical protein
MAASKYDFAIEQGSSFKISLFYKDPNGDAINLTNWCARLIWKTNTNITQVFTTENDDYGVYKFTIDEVAGKLTLMIPASKTNEFIFNTAKYDLELQSPDDLYGGGGGKYIIRLLYGTITIIKRFSQSATLLECSP